MTAPSFGYVAIVIGRGARKGFTTDLFATRAEAAQAAFARARTLATVMTERRYAGALAGSDIQWLHRRDLLAPLTTADHAARAASIPRKD